MPRLKKDGTVDKRSFNRGKKGSGRKSKAEEMGLKDVLTTNMPFEELISLIAESARKGNWPAQKELLDRYVGKEAKSLIVDQSVEHKGVDVEKILLNAYGQDQSDIPTTTDGE